MVLQLLMSLLLVIIMSMYLKIFMDLEIISRGSTVITVP